jgi:hypothetical protein
MPTPRNNSNSRNAQVNANTNDVDFVKGAPNLDVQGFLDEMVLADGGRFIDFKYDSGMSARGNKRKASFLTVKMPKYVPTEDGMEPVVDENGEVELTNTTIYAAKDANDLLVKQKGSTEPLKGISVSAYHETDQATGKRTGKVGFMLTKSSGESVDAASLGLRL